MASTTSTTITHPDGTTISVTTTTAGAASPSSAAKVLVLGAGLVTRPGVKYLAEAGFAVTVASRTVARVEKLIEGFPNCNAVGIDAGAEADQPALAKLIEDCDLVLSLLPWTMHTPVAKLAVKYKKHFASTSYISDEMQAMDGLFKANGKVSFNECGVDPGLDHMSAMKIIHDAHSKGDQVKSFLSYCGGLPCPEDNTNPFGYKFSWSPRGVLLAAVRQAYFIEGGEKQEFNSSPGRGIYENFTIANVPHVGPPITVPWPAGFESHPNGDSVKFKDIYGIAECEHLVRGTYRNLGWCTTMQMIKNLGMLSEDSCEADLAGKTYAEVLAAELGCTPDGVKEAAATKLSVATDDEALGRLEWLGLFSSEKKADAPTKLDATCKLFQDNEKFWFAEGERDMICMHHTFLITKKDGSKEKTTSTLIDYGIKNGDTSMARTVTLPIAIAIKAILSGTFKCTGVVRPITPELYNPILSEMEDYGMKFVETTTAM